MKKHLRLSSFVAMVALAFASSAVCAKDAPAAYTLKDKVDTCKPGYDRVVVESVKTSADGSVTFKYQGAPAMGPVPKKFAGQYAAMKAGDVQCLPGSKT